MECGNIFLIERGAGEGNESDLFEKVITPRLFVSHSHTVDIDIFSSRLCKAIIRYLILRLKTWAPKRLFLELDTVK